MVIKKLFFFVVAGLSLAGVQASELEKKRESDEEVLSAIRKINFDPSVSKVKLVYKGKMYVSPHEEMAHVMTLQLGQVRCSKVCHASEFDGIQRGCSHNIPSRGWAVMRKLWRQQEKPQ
jgi:hypothetical protein